ncbi:MAG: AAA family ATPase [Planctomycetota bacterium]|nr:AAA family ATPase [Planctomycetota bacterium]
MTTDRSTFPDPIEIQAQLDKQIQGQTRAKRDLAVAIYNHYITQHLSPESDATPQHLLLLGPAGVGKSFLVQQAAELLGVPWIHADASSLVQPVLAGEEVERIIGALVQRAGGDFNHAQKGIILIDRLDTCRRTIAGPGDPGIAVQDSLLAMMDGLVMNHRDPSVGTLDTSGILFICCGSFPEITEVVLGRLGEDDRIGFQAEEDDDGDQTNLIINDVIERTDLVTLGIGPELAARFGNISLLKELDEDDFIHILDKMEHGIIAQKKRFWAEHGIDLNFEEGALRAIARKARQAGEGARGLHGIVERVLDPIDHRPVEMARAGIERIDINEACVDEKAEPPTHRSTDGGTAGQVDRLLTEVWTSLQIDPDTEQEAPIAIDPAIQALPVAGLAAAIAQMEMALGRLGLTTEQDRTWRELLKKYPNKGMQIILQLLAQTQKSGVSLGTLCDAIKKTEGDLAAALDSIS